MHVGQVCDAMALCTERPQEVYDHRTLYERLKQQRDKKQEEWEDQFKFSECVLVTLTKTMAIDNIILPTVRPYKVYY